uniref:C2H2-type domain-containing protein n=1 Tax=Kalanchoe fedtschenkoi TaxID=63787 RepID=A0A7N0TWR2_KALFE
MLTSSGLTDFSGLMNPAYNPDVLAYFPQPSIYPQPDASDAHLAVVDSSVAFYKEKSSTPESLSVQPDRDVLSQKKGNETLRCEICSINCNSKVTFENHLLGKKHQKKMKALNPNNSISEPVKTVHADVAETKNVNDVENGALPDSEKVSTAGSLGCESQALFDQHLSAKKHTSVVEGEDDDTVMLKASDICASEVSEIHKSAQQESSASVVEDYMSCNSEEVHEEILSNKKHTTQVKADNFGDLMLHASDSDPAECIDGDNSNLLKGRATRNKFQFCEVCNIFSTSQAELEKHLAGKKHARRVKNLDTVMSSPAIVDPIDVMASNKLNPASCGTVAQSTFSRQAALEEHLPVKQNVSEVRVKDACTQTDLSSFHTVDSLEFKESNASDGGTKMWSSNICTTCNISCTSQERLHAHLAGKKHASKVRWTSSTSNTHNLGLSSNSDGLSRNLPSVQFQEHDPIVTSHADPMLTDASSIMPVAQENNHLFKSDVSMKFSPTPITSSVDPLKDDNSDGQLSVCMEPDETHKLTPEDHESDAQQKASKRAKTILFAYCDICKVHCSSNENLSAHKMGRNHLKLLAKLGIAEEVTPTPGNDMLAPKIGSPHQDNANKSSLSELSLNVRNQDEASKGMINSQNHNTHHDGKIGCTLCNITCNSETVFLTHLAGRKHAAVARRAAQIGIGMVTPGLQVMASN